MKYCHCAFGWVVVGLAVLLLGGCSAGRVMMPTPNVYLDERLDVYSDLHPELKSTQVKLFYITDRLPEQDENGMLHYGHGRSSSLAFGSAVVELGTDITWEQLIQASHIPKRSQDVKLTAGEVTELIRTPNTPLPYTVVDGKVIEEPEELSRRADARAAMRKLLTERLAKSSRKEVFLYVHGYHNTFDDAAFALAELWHFLGRIGVPIIYTWPAGYPGMFGYTYDRESSEFTIYHLREAIEIISSFPEVEKIHIIAHSRGTDVAMNALRELTLRIRGAGIDPKRQLKIHNFVLAAPDIDVTVAEQRFIGDALTGSVHRFTVYTSPVDKAIGFANKFFQSPRGRVGTFGPEFASETIKNTMVYSNTNFAIVNFTGASDVFSSQGDDYGHSYFRNAPAVSSDLVLMLRDDLDPGVPERPLEQVSMKFWRIPEGYPDVKQGEKHSQ